MQDPSYGVPQQLVNHVHLISGNPYPYLPHMGLEQAFQYLFEAPKIVKQLAPMAWQYLQAPQDGKVFLTWIGGRMSQTFPTDGYVWADQERHYHQDVGGYTVEIAVHSSGYRPGVDQMACHARHRYRLVSKLPHTVANPPDTSLWIVHYSQAEQQAFVPAAHVPMTPQTQQHLQERRWIEQQGRLERQDFMLHDREKWPHLNMPGRSGSAGMPGGQMYGQMQHGQNPMAHIGNPRFSGHFYQQSQQPLAGPSPAKRQRPNPPTHMSSTTAAMLDRDTSIEDEENVLLGDAMDQLTQRDISLAKYIQHHEWMEEIFSSPYATGQILPIDLGFGLMGELAGLTEGLFEPPLSDQEKAPGKNGEKALTFAKTEPEQLQEFEKRVVAHLDQGQDELKRMKADHAKKMAELKRSNILSQAEKKLRNASWILDDAQDEPPKADSANGTKESVDAIVGEIEELLRVNIVPQNEATLVERGGLREKMRELPETDHRPTNSADQTRAATSAVDGFLGQDMLQSAQVSRQPSTAPQATPSLQHTPAPMPIGPVSQTSAQQITSQPQDNASLQTMQAMDDLKGLDMLGGNDMSLMDDMDLDVEDSNLPFDEDDLKDGTNDWTTGQDSITADVKSGNQATDFDNDASAGAGGEESSMFNADSKFYGDFDASDGLIDFEGGESGDMGLDLDMDNSAFGDAFHGTEAHVEGGEAAE